MLPLVGSSGNTSLILSAAESDVLYDQADVRDQGAGAGRKTKCNVVPPCQEARAACDERRGSND